MSAIRRVAPFAFVAATLVACGTVIGLPNQEATLAEDAGVAADGTSGSPSSSGSSASSGSSGSSSGGLPDAGGFDAETCGTDPICHAQLCPSGQAYCPLTGKCVTGCADFSDGGGCATSMTSYAIDDCSACPDGGAPVHVCTNTAANIGGACAKGTQPRCACTYCPVDDTHLCLDGGCYSCGEQGTSGKQCLAGSTCNTSDRRCCGGC